MLNRRHAVREILKHRTKELVVTGLGAPTYDVADADDNPLNFYFWGAMGGAMLCGLGLALTRPDDHVMVITGDGEALMGLGSFAAIAQHNPDNLSIIILDNESYGETGLQDSATASGVSLASVAQSCGIENTRTVSTDEELHDLQHALKNSSETSVSVIKIAAENQPRVTPLRDGVELKVRFKSALKKLDSQ